MVVVNVSPLNDNPNITEIIPFATPSIRKFNDPAALNSLIYSDVVANTSIEEHHDFTKSSNTRHRPNVESHNKE